MDIKKLTRKERYNYMFDYLLNTAIGMFDYKNLPESIPHKNLEKYLLLNGQAAIYDYNGKPYAFNGNFGGINNIYHEPTRYIIANEVAGDYDLDLNDIIIAKNDTLMTGIRYNIQKYSRLLTECDITLETAVILSRMQILISASDERTYQSAQKYLEKLKDGEISIIGESAFFDGIKMQTRQGNNQVNEIIAIVQYIRGLFLQSIGINQAKTYSKEYVQESIINRDGIRPMIDNMLKNRKEWVEKYNKKYSANISVDLSEAWKSEENRDNGDGMNEKAKNQVAYDKQREIKKQEERKEIK